MFFYYQEFYYFSHFYYSGGCMNNFSVTRSLNFLKAISFSIVSMLFYFEILLFFLYFLVTTWGVTMIFYFSMFTFILFLFNLFTNFNFVSSKK